MLISTGSWRAEFLGLQKLWNVSSMHGGCDVCSMAWFHLGLVWQHDLNMDACMARGYLQKARYDLENGRSAGPER